MVMWKLSYLIAYFTSVTGLLIHLSLKLSNSSSYVEKLLEH